jgi:hypothetical protein
VAEEGAVCGWESWKVSMVVERYGGVGRVGRGLANEKSKGVGIEDGVAFVMEVWLNLEG